jgi:hypothetical protein
MLLAVFPAMLPLPTYAHLKGSIFPLRYLPPTYRPRLNKTQILFIISTRRVGINKQIVNNPAAGPANIIHVFTDLNG